MKQSTLKTELKKKQAEYEEWVKNFTGTNFLTDFGMQLFLHQNGFPLYNPIIDNDVPTTLLEMLATDFGYHWDASVELWVH
jgi:hypothetical protein